MTAVQTWQPVIGYLLGIVTVLVAALVGFRLNRARDEHLRLQEVKSIAAALYAEIIMLRVQAAKMANVVAKRFVQHGMGRRDRPFDEHLFEMIPMPSAPIYEGLSSQIGKLPAHLLLGIVQFYSAYEDARYWLPRLEEKEERPFTYSVLTVLHPALDAVEGIQDTLISIEALVGISPNSELPDLKQAKEVAEWEEEQWAEIREQGD
ncbi:hypothetical protein LVY65_07325 [Sphingomonas sp. G124]|uniref:Uncharacterized protein n=1 Tax=Sphingomonas cremea TaxID=2904799 RepID=A0A9X1QLS4_9SPHN|nr:hypothetical protein [Sphingomonas cremea]MCF2514874.1 hypothetical protein [Sphingomonas cremea]